MTEAGSPEGLTGSEELTKVPSNLSISSITSTGSTEKLIKSLSKDHLPQAPENGGIATPVLSGIPEAGRTLSPNSALSDASPKKKPIKFTVRKVSHGAIKSPILENSNMANQQKQPTKEALNLSEHLKATQSKYDLYAARISKIDKEIAFLTNLLPPHNVEVDYSTRTKITRAIEKLRMKQDEIEKKKYSLGITISRLWREHDDSDIWVRSVSNQ